MTLTDPRSHRRYTDTARRHIALAPPTVPCALCHHDVDTTLSAGPGKPTVEHRLPIRTILATARTQAEALTLACDVTMWGIAHSRCQSQQGAGVTNSRSSGTPSRDW